VQAQPSLSCTCPNCAKVHEHLEPGFFKNLRMSTARHELLMYQEGPYTIPCHYSCLTEHAEAQPQPDAPDIACEPKELLHHRAML
jgi:hypothetical protein